MCGSFLFLNFYVSGPLACLSLPGQFVGDPASLARDNMFNILKVILSVLSFLISPTKL